MHIVEVLNFQDLSYNSWRQQDIELCILHLYRLDLCTYIFFHESLWIWTCRLPHLSHPLCAEPAHGISLHAWDQVLAPEHWQRLQAPEYAPCPSCRWSVLILSPKYAARAKVRCQWTCHRLLLYITHDGIQVVQGIHDAHVWALGGAWHVFALKKLVLGAQLVLVFRVLIIKLNIIYRWPSKCKKPWWSTLSSVAWVRAGRIILHLKSESVIWHSSATRFHDSHNLTRWNENLMINILALAAVHSA